MVDIVMRSLREILKSGLISFALIIPVVVVHSETVNWTHEVHIDEIVRASRRYILKGEFDALLRDLGSRVGPKRSFQNIEIRRHLDQSPVTVRDNYQFSSTKNHLESMLQTKISRSVFFDAERTSLMAEMTFSFDRFKGLDYVTFVFLIIFSLVHLFRIRNLRRRQVEQSKSLEAAKNRAIASTTQAIAHDVRKPFSTVKSAIQAIESVESLEELHETLPIVTRQVNKALVSVEGLLVDVMELDKKGELVREVVSPLVIVKEVLEEIYQINQKVDISIELSFAHTHLLYVDKTRVHRIFANIINNAVQAIPGGRGKIWIHTKPTANDMTEFTLGNSGSVIPKAACAHLFEAFYTSGKKGGTGLGLAIAKKITEAHGGNIFVESDEDEKTVEFTFTLPAAKELDESDRSTRPTRLADYAIIKKSSNLSMRELSAAQAHLVSKLVEHHQRQNADKVKVVLLDDEAIYRDGVVGLVRGSDVASLLEFVHFSSPEQILAEDPSGWHSVISDVDLMHPELNGYDVVAKLNADRRFSGSCCIHSNKAFASDIEKALKAGAKGFQPKPMTLEHLLKFVVDYLPKAVPNEKSQDFQYVSEKLGGNDADKPLIAFVDDDSFLRKFFPKKMSDAEVHTFASPEEFWVFAESSENLASLKAVITDNYFDDQSQTVGVEFTEQLRKRFSGSIVLYSDGVFSPAELEHVDLHLPKGSFPSWAELAERLEST